MTTEAMTRVVVTIARHEVCTYEFDGVVDASAVDDLIGSGDYEPVDSNIRSEDIDIVDIRVMYR